MSLVQFVGVLLALGLILVTLWDSFLAVFSANGAGPLTRFWTPLVWRGLLAIHRRWPIHGLLSLAGPAMLLCSIVIWYGLLGLGLWIMLALYPASVVDTAGQTVNLVQKLYFVNTTLSSLGYGDLIPAGYPWTLLNTGATLAATIVLTVSLSYVLSVLAAALERRSLAQGIFGLGKDLREFIEGIRWDENGTAMQVHVLSLASQVNNQTNKVLAYPILKFFHSPQPHSSLARAILLLSDGFFVLRLKDPAQQPPADVQRLVERAIASFAACTDSRLRPRHHERAHKQIDELLRELGIHHSVDQATYRQALQEYLPQRHRLLALCREDGWNDP